MLGVSLDPPANVMTWVDQRLVEHIGWGKLRAVAVEWAASRGDFESAGSLSLGPDARKYAALGALQKGDLKSAIDHMEQYLQAAPSDALAWATLGRVLLATGDVAAADTAMRRAFAARESLDTAAQQSLDHEMAAYAAERRMVTGQEAP